MTVFEQIADLKVVPVIAIESADMAVTLAQTLKESGLPIAEITFRTSAATDVLRKIASQYPDFLLGAGTILTERDLKSAIDSGAKFGMAPGFNPQIVELARKLDFPFAPGVCTPSEIEIAMSIGCKQLKFFPAGAMGGVAFLKAILAPYLHTGIEVMPTGGVQISNLMEYLKTKGVGACGGTWIATREDIAGGKWKTIAARCDEIKMVTNSLK